MNKRIKELIEEAVKTTLLEHSTSFVNVTIEGENVNKTVASIPTEFCEKFAKLIIDECCDICYDNEYMSPNQCAWRIEAHFED